MCLNICESLVMERMLNDPFGAEASAACSLGAYLVHIVLKHSERFTWCLVLKLLRNTKHPLLKQHVQRVVLCSHVLKHGDEPLC